MDETVTFQAGMLQNSPENIGPTSNQQPRSLASTRARPQVAMGFFGMVLKPGQKEAVEVPPGWCLQLCTAALEPAKAGVKVNMRCGVQCGVGPPRGILRPTAARQAAPLRRKKLLGEATGTE